LFITKLPKKKVERTLLFLILASTLLIQVTMGEVTSLDHKVGQNPMEFYTSKSHQNTTGPYEDLKFVF